MLTSLPSGNDTLSDVLISESFDHRNGIPIRRWRTVWSSDTSQLSEMVFAPGAQMTGLFDGDRSGPPVESVSGYNGQVRARHLGFPTGSLK